jgi:hypothetical protein
MNLVERIARSANEPDRRKIHFPSKDQQRAKFTERLESLANEISNTKGNIVFTTPDTNPEATLVLECKGSPVDVQKAIVLADLEWLGESAFKSEPDEDTFYEIEPEAKLDSRLFLVLVDPTGTTKILELWRKYLDGAKFERGTAPIGQVFKMLKSVRLWSAEDRISGTGIDAVMHKILAEIGDPEVNVDEPLRIEVELWYRTDPGKRDHARSVVERIVGESGGTLLKEYALTPIRYHGLLIEVSKRAFVDLLSDDEGKFGKLINAEAIRLIWPSAQAYIADISLLEREQVVPQEEAKASGEPIAALLDGLPMQNHELLQGFLEVDDEDNVEERYPANRRVHGTAMASIIINGDYGADHERNKYKLYCRPILFPKPQFRGFAEAFPEDQLMVEVLHRAVLRAIKVRPTIFIFNLSIGDSSRPLRGAMSPLSRLIDWLAFEHSLLFIISAGNVRTVIEHGNATAAVLQAAGLDRSRATLRLLNEETPLQSILCPSESINALTIGALHADGVQEEVARDGIVDLFPPPRQAGVLLPSIISAVGPGYGGMIKPDMALPGGRVYYQQTLVAEEGLELVEHKSLPGIKVASPLDGGTRGIASSWGTSNSAAYATHLACISYSALQEPHNQFVLPDRIKPLAVKGMLLHSCSWNNSLEFYTSAWNIGREQVKKRLAAFIGHGRAEREKLLGSDDHRVTLVAWDEIVEGSGLIYSVPLPLSMSGQQVSWKVTATLSWLSPINTSVQAYRQANLWFELLNDDAYQVRRTDVERRMARRGGTVQHELFSGERVLAFNEGEALLFKVNCAEDARGLGERQIQFFFVASLEVSPGIGLPIFNEVATSLAAQVPVAIEVS